MNLFFFIPCYLCVCGQVMPCPLCHNTINGRKLGFSLKKKTFRTIFPERIPPGIVSSKSAEIGWKALGNLISTRTDLCNQSFNERHTSWKELFLNFDFINVLHHTGFFYQCLTSYRILRSISDMRRAFTYFNYGTSSTSKSLYKIKSA